MCDVANNLVIYCLPVSGGKFVNQLGLLCEIFVAKKKYNKGILKGSKYYAPDLVFGSSGGNVSAYLGLAADWSDDGIERLAQKISSDIFIKSWLPKEFNFIPSWALSLSNGSFYRKGKGAVELFNEWFTPKTIKNVEIWTGTYNVTNKKAQFFCNLDKNESMIDCLDIYEEKMFNMLPLKYLNGCLNSCAIASAASATIPGFVETQLFEELNYADGGITDSSPLNVFSAGICRTILGHNVKDCVKNNIIYDGEHIVENKIESNYIKSSYILDIENDICNKMCNSEKKMRLIYFSSYQTNESNNTKNGNIFLESCQQLFHSCLLKDQHCAVNILKTIAGERINEIKQSNFKNMNTNKLAELFAIIENYKHYVLILSPKGKPQISLERINPEEMLSKIRSARIDYSADLWYLE